jgi:hypothetical protein
MIVKAIVNCCPLYDYYFNPNPVEIFSIFKDEVYCVKYIDKNKVWLEGKLSPYNFDNFILVANKKKNSVDDGKEE